MHKSDFFRFCNSNFKDCTRTIFNLKATRYNDCAVMRFKGLSYEAIKFIRNNDWWIIIQMEHSRTITRTHFNAQCDTNVRFPLSALILDFQTAFDDPIHGHGQFLKLVDTPYRQNCVPWRENWRETLCHRNKRKDDNFMICWWRLLRLIEWRLVEHSLL